MKTKCFPTRNKSAASRQSIPITQIQKGDILVVQFPYSRFGAARRIKEVVSKLVPPEIKVLAVREGHQLSVIRPCVDSERNSRREAQPQSASRIANEFPLQGENLIFSDPDKGEYLTGIQCSLLPLGDPGELQSLQVILPFEAMISTSDFYRWSLRRGLGVWKCGDFDLVCLVERLWSEAVRPRISQS